MDKKALEILLNKKGWLDHLTLAFKTTQVQHLCEYLQKLRCYKTIYPSQELVYRPLIAVPFDKVKVVILADEPYSGNNQANGFAFGVNPGKKIPPILSNIKNEIDFDLKSSTGKWDCSLEGWADQGVLLLNMTATVEAGNPGSHQGFGWEVITDQIIKSLGDSGRPIVWMLWGDKARSKEGLIDRMYNLILESASPDPKTAKDFFGRGHFSKTNQFLIDKGLAPIDWTKIERKEVSLYDRMFK